MKAAVYFKYGDVSQISIADVLPPVLKPHQVLIDVHATAINGSDWEFLTGKPAYARIGGLFKPRKPILGSDISGVVSAVGGKVGGFKVGDAVFCDNFDRLGGFAEQVAVDAKLLVKKPKDVSHVLAASIPQSGVIALQGINHLRPLLENQRILINGAGGSGGGYAIQLAKLAGAHVTAVDHGNKQAFIERMGADEFIDYNKEDVSDPKRYANESDKFHKILDFVGRHSLYGLEELMCQTGCYSIVGGYISELLGVNFRWANPSSRNSSHRHCKFGVLVHRQNKQDMNYLMGLLRGNEIQSCVNHEFALDDIQQAFELFGTQQTSGKVVIRVR